MALLFLLNGKELHIAAAECTAALYPRDWWDRLPEADDGLAFFPLARKAPQHLGLTHRIIDVLAVTQAGDAALRAGMSGIAWAKVLRNKSFRVRLTRKRAVSAPLERDLASLILARAKRATVDLEHPGVTIDIVCTPRASYIGQRVGENAQRWKDRRAHLWASPHPTALHPTMARALTRLAGSKRVHDPCCGAGGIVIEAALAGLRVSGGDVEASMIARARKNARAFGLRPDLRVVDAISWIPRCGAIVTDLPYGRSTKAVRIDAFVTALLLRAQKSTRRAVIGSSEPLPHVSGWTVRARMTSYVHRSLTRHFTVLERDAPRSAKGKLALPAVALAFGTFDILHPGHQYYLRQASRLARRLEVVVARDATVRKVKRDAPVHDEGERLAAVRALPYVAHARLGNLGDKHAIVREIAPDVIALGYDQRSFTDGLQESLAAAGLRPRIARVSAFEPHKHKSSLMRRRSGSRARSSRRSPSA